MITVNEHIFDELTALEIVFDKVTAGCCEWPERAELSGDKPLEQLAFRVSRAPRSLCAHVERIHYCCSNFLDEQLLAVIDVLIVLNKTGRELNRRMILGSRLCLTGSQFQALRYSQENQGDAAESLPCSRFSSFNKGLPSSLLRVQGVKEAPATEFDPLQLARDYVEFSPLDEAARVLEQAIMTHPKCPELHGELLSL